MVALNVYLLSVEVMYSTMTVVVTASSEEAARSYAAAGDDAFGNADRVTCSRVDTGCAGVVATFTEGE